MRRVLPVLLLTLAARSYAALGPTNVCGDAHSRQQFADLYSISSEQILGAQLHFNVTVPAISVNGYRFVALYVLYYEANEEALRVPLATEISEERLSSFFYIAITKIGHIKLYASYSENPEIAHFDGPYCEFELQLKAPETLSMMVSPNSALEPTRKSDVN